jgi:hypothetical protein
MGHPGAGIESEQLHARTLRLIERPQEQLPRLRMFDQVSGGFRDHQRQRTRFYLGQPKTVGHLEGGAARGGDLAGLRDGDAVYRHGRWLLQWGIVVALAYLKADPAKFEAE